MRLTVHLKNVEKKDTEVNTKDGVKKIKTLKNTLAFYGVKPNQVQSILKSIPKEQGTPVKHYLSNSKVTGMATSRKGK